MKGPKNKLVLPAMTRDEYDELPPAVQYFIPWNKAKRPLTIKPVSAPDRAKYQEGYRYFTERQP